MAQTLEQFRQQIVDSGLISGADLSDWLDGLPDQQRPADAEQLARELVRHKKLTAWQVKAFYQGQGKSLLMGNYVVLDKLGQGGMGMVLKARHRRMNRLVALKVLSPGTANSPTAIKRFHREVQAAARLEHPNIVTAYDADEAGGKHFLVMQFVDGCDLASLVKQEGRLPVEKAVGCVLQAARGLATPTTEQPVAEVEPPTAPLEPELQEQHFTIRYGETGHCYESIVGPYLKGASELHVEDPYIRLTHQVQNFVRFCEAVVKLSAIKKIRLVTSYDNQEQLTEVQQKFEELTQSLLEMDIVLEVKLNPKLHDREIRMDNGWVVKIGRGLDFYQRPANWFEIGVNDLSLRKCLETKVDIFRATK